jgi:hypothetical protein
MFGIVAMMAILACAAMPAMAATNIVSNNSADPLTANSFPYWLVNSADGDTINFSGNFTIVDWPEDGSIVVAANNLTVDGGANTILIDNSNTAGTATNMLIKVTGNGFTWNNVDAQGAGMNGWTGAAVFIQIQGDDSTVTNSTFSGNPAGSARAAYMPNSASYLRYGTGGTGVVQDGITIQNCDFRGPVSDSMYGGGGIKLCFGGSDKTNILVEGCTFQGFNDQALSIEPANTTDPTVTNVVFRDNEFGLCGGTRSFANDIHFYNQDGSPFPLDNLLIENNVHGVPLDGEGLVLPRPSFSCALFYVDMDNVLIQNETWVDLQNRGANIINFCADGALGTEWLTESVVFSENEVARCGTLPYLIREYDGTDIQGTLERPIITSATVDTVTGTAEANAKVEVFVSPLTANPVVSQGAYFRPMLDTFLGSTTADGSGNWTFAMPAYYGGYWVSATQTTTGAYPNTSWRHGTAVVGNPDTGGLDTDIDYLPDTWETDNSLDPNLTTTPNGTMDDPDADGFSNLHEYMYGSDPQDPDSTPETVSPPWPGPDMPVAGIAGLAMLLAGLGAVGYRRIRK